MVSHRLLRHRADAAHIRQGKRRSPLSLPIGPATTTANTFRATEKDEVDVRQRKCHLADQPPIHAVDQIANVTYCFPGRVLAEALG